MNGSATLPELMKARSYAKSITKRNHCRTVVSGLRDAHRKCSRRKRGLRPQIALDWASIASRRLSTLFGLQELQFRRERAAIQSLFPVKIFDPRPHIFTRHRPFRQGVS